MERFANKTFFKFLFGFIAIVSLSFIAILGTTYLAEQDEMKNTAQVECVEGENC